MDLNGSGGDGGWSLDAIKRYFTLQRYLPKNGGLFGSGWAHRRPPEPGRYRTREPREMPRPRASRRARFGG